MKSVKDWLIDKWLAGFINGLLILALKIIWDMKPEEKGSLLSFNWFWNLMKMEFPIWSGVILLVIFVVFHRIQVKKIDFQKHNEAARSRPRADFEIYNQDFFGMRKEEWTWRYEFDEETDRYLIVNLLPVCPVCKTESHIFQKNIHPFQGLCPKCRLEGRMCLFEFSSQMEDVRLEIARRIKSGDYKSIAN